MDPNIYCPRKLKKTIRNSVPVTLNKTIMAIKNHLLATLLVMLSCFSFSCSNENEEDLLPKDDRCEDQTVTLSGDIIPIINQNCAVSGCHVSGTGRVNFSLEENIIAKARQIRSFTESSFMPPQASGKKLSDVEKELIFCWVERGALDN